MRTFTRSKAFIVIAALVVAIVGFGSGAAYALTTTKSGTSVSRSVVHTNDSAVVFTSTAFTNVGSTTLFANAGNHILARFTAESACTGAVGSGWCSIRILIDGVEADPAAGTDFAFDATDNGADSISSWVSASVERARTVTFTGNHTIVVQAALVTPANQFRLDDWTLSGLVLVP